VSKSGLADIRHWAGVFSDHCKDRRYYELVDDTIRQGFDYRYLVFKNGRNEVSAIQPVFLLDQDLLAATPDVIKSTAFFIRRWWPRFMQLRTLMVGCAAGEGRLDRQSRPANNAFAVELAQALEATARTTQARLIVLKEFPSEYRNELSPLLSCGYTRIPSFPMVALQLDYADFEDYMRRGISRSMRGHLRRKFHGIEQEPPIEMSILTDVTPIIDEVYPLYLQVYERAPLRFERLTPDFFCEIGRTMPDKARFFVWRQAGKPVAFGLSMVHGDTVYGEYLGLDYAVALRLHLYFIVFRDLISWSIANGYRRYVSTSLGYDPKLHLRFKLMPLDLYVRHTSPLTNNALKWFLPLLEPTRYDKTLQKFENYDRLWDDNDGPETDRPSREAAPRWRKAYKRWLQFAARRWRFK